MAVNGIKLRLCFYPFCSTKTYLKWLLVLVFERFLHGLSLANMPQQLCPAPPVCVGSLVTAWLCSVIICPFPGTSFFLFDTLAGISCCVLLFSFSAPLFLSSQKLHPLQKFLPPLVKISTISPNTSLLLLKSYIFLMLGDILKQLCFGGSGLVWEKKVANTHCHRHQTK